MNCKNCVRLKRVLAIIKVMKAICDETNDMCEKEVKFLKSVTDANQITLLSKEVQDASSKNQ